MVVAEDVVNIELNSPWVFIFKKKKNLNINKLDFSLIHDKYDI